MPAAARERLQRRARLLADLRAWMAERQVLEADTPALWPWANTDPAIASLPAGDGFLHTSPEFGLKRLLALGSGDVYQLGHVFRSEENGPLHRNEFLMLEWYRLGLDHRQLAEEVLALIQHLRALRGLPVASSETLSYRALFQRHAGLDPFDTDEARLRQHCRQQGLQGWHGRQAALDFLLAVVIEPQLDADTLYVVLDYPPEQAALARLHTDSRGQAVAARFEVFAGPMELANGYHELPDGAAYRQRFQQENRHRQQQGLPAMPADDPLCRLLEQQPLPDCAGVALGVDRLQLYLQGETDLAALWPAALDPYRPIT